MAHFIDFAGLMVSLFGASPLVLALAGGTIASLLNMIGATPVLLFKRVSKNSVDLGLSFAAGVMLTASFTSLIIPGIKVGGIWAVTLGIALGALAVSLADYMLPHIRFVLGRNEVATERLRAIWLFVIAITLHNMPEGLAVGVGFGSGDISRAIVLMLAIGIQNMPEGLSVGFSLIATGRYTRNMAYLIAVASGFVEAPISLLGAWAVSLASSIIPYAMGFAAGAMIFVIGDEIIPETHRLGRQRRGTFSMIVGVVLMLILDILLG